MWETQNISSKRHKEPGRLLIFFLPSGRYKSAWFSRQFSCEIVPYFSHFSLERWLFSYFHWIQALYCNFRKLSINYLAEENLGCSPSQLYWKSLLGTWSNPNKIFTQSKKNKFLSLSGESRKGRDAS